MININIQQIANGFLVALPPVAANSNQRIQTMTPQQASQAVQPVVKFAEDFHGVVALIKANWPITVEE